MNHLVIMAGGVGSRFWPMSTPERPKQFIDVLGTGRTLLQLTVARFREVCPPERVWVVTSARYRDLVREQLPQVPRQNILLEPCMRNTAPCIAYVTWKIRMRDPEAVLVVSPSDHIVADVPEFVRVVRKGLDFVSGKDAILTLGMRPDRPETGYGYIRLAGTPGAEEEIVEVESFREKPDLQTAKAYLESGDYCWNSGIFIWNASTVEKALRANRPEMAAIFDSLQPAFYTEGEQEAVNRLFPDCPAISIDYAVMEHADNLYVFPADFGWSDLGTWGSLYGQLPKDGDGNAVVGRQVRMAGSRNCVVHVPEGRKMLLEGLDGYIVAEENGVIMVCRLADEQHIRSFSAGFDEK